MLKNLEAVGNISLMEKEKKDYKIRIYGDPILRQKASEIGEINGEIATLAQDMISVLHQAKGLGLAAPQVGRSLALCIINLPALDAGRKDPLVLINPRVLGSHGRLVHQEGCLSFPELYAEVARPQSVGIRAWDINGREVELEADEMLARVFLHEIDHLNGVLFIDHLSQLKRQLLKNQLRHITKLVQDGNGLKNHARDSQI